MKGSYKETGDVTRKNFFRLYGAVYFVFSLAAYLDCYDYPYDSCGSKFGFHTRIADPQPFPAFLCGGNLEQLL
jgi:hypothetical protein